MRYIAVLHKWFVDSNGFETHQLKSTTKEEAENEAKLLTFNKQSGMNKVAYTVVEINDDETLTTEFNHKLNYIPEFIKWLFIPTD